MVGFKYKGGESSFSSYELINLSAKITIIYALISSDCYLFREAIVDPTFIMRNEFVILIYALTGDTIAISYIAYVLIRSEQ